MRTTSPPSLCPRQEYKFREVLVDNQAIVACPDMVEDGRIGRFIIIIIIIIIIIVVVVVIIQ